MCSEKNQNGFRKDRSNFGQILTVWRNFEGDRSKNLQAALHFVDVCKAFSSVHRSKEWRIRQ